MGLLIKLTGFNVTKYIEILNKSNTLSLYLLISLPFTYLSDHWMFGRLSIIGNYFCSTVESEHVFEPIDSAMQVCDNVFKLFRGLSEDLTLTPHLFSPLLTFSNAVGDHPLIFFNFFDALASIFS
jgi:hypothetical protein